MFSDVATASIDLKLYSYIWNVTDGYICSLALIHADNPLLGFLAYSGVDSMLAVELGHGEYLLAFHTLAIYVDSQGRKSRETEIMYPAVPVAISEF